MSTGTPGRWVLPVRHFLIGVTRVIFRVNRDLGLTTNRPIPGGGRGLSVERQARPPASLAALPRTVIY